ncbi:methyltransferase-like protein 25B [Argonauta hians]
MTGATDEPLWWHQHIVTDDQISQLVRFISKHQWVYNFQFTKFFVEQVWKKVPNGWLEYLTTLTTGQLKQVTQGEVQADCPDSLRDYVEKCLTLSAHQKHLESIECQPLESSLTEGLSRKKKHEVTAMSTVVHKIASRANIHTLVDIGSGLGYVDHALSSTYGYDILGVECRENFAHKSEMRAAQFDLQQLPSCKFSTCVLQLQQSDDCMQRLKEALGNHLQRHHQQTPATAPPSPSPPLTSPSPPPSALTPALVAPARSCADAPIMLMGLHCCGDLTPTVLNTFMQMHEACTLCCISCCYHKMDYSENQQRFTNFPLSTKAKQVFGLHEKETGNYHPYSHLNVFALRLAAQQKKYQWLNQTEAQYEFSVKNVKLRGLLEILFLKEGIPHSKQLCRVKKKCDYSTPKSYIDAVLSKLQPLSGYQVDHLSKQFLQLHEDNEPNFQYIEPITCLQVLLQPVLETLVHYDRLAFLQENGCQASLVPLFDEQISPRNIMIVAEKI